MEVVGSSPTKAQIPKHMKHESKDPLLVSCQRTDTLHIRSISCGRNCVVVRDLYLYHHAVYIFDLQDQSKILVRSEVKRVTSEAVFIKAQ